MQICLSTVHSRNVILYNMVSNVFTTLILLICTYSYYFVWLSKLIFYVALYLAFVYNNLIVTMLTVHIICIIYLINIDI